MYEYIYAMILPIEMANGNVPLCQLSTVNLSIQESMSQTDLERFFRQFDGTEMVQRRLFRDRRESPWKFTGSVFVTFKVKDQAEHVRVLFVTCDISSMAMFVRRISVR